MIKLEQNTGEMLWERSLVQENLQCKALVSWTSCWKSQQSKSVAQLSSYNIVGYQPCIGISPFQIRNKCNQTQEIIFL